jgi:cell division protein FtsQ
VVATRFGWRRWLAVGITLLAFASMAMAARSVARYVSADPRFTLSRERPGSLQLRGLVYTSRPKVMRVFANDFERSLYSIPLDERRRRLLAIDWIESASVARIWPDRLVVTVQERKPVAFVRSRSAIMLIDRHGVLLEQPPQARFTFPFLAGVDSSQTEAERAVRVRRMLDLLQELGTEGKDVSEIDTTENSNLRVVVKAGNAAVELLLGDTNYLSRYQTFTRTFSQVPAGLPDGKVFDLRIDGSMLERK